MNILVFDSNRVFANHVAERIAGFVPQAFVDTCPNIYILKRRLENKTYDLILADVLSTIDADEVIAVLSEIKTLVVIWTPLSTDMAWNLMSECKRDFIRKPSLPDVQAALTPYVARVSNRSAPV